MPIFSTIFPTLPKYPGPYDVGTVDVEIPLAPEKTKNFPVTETSVETVLVRFFYPADLSKVPRSKRHASPLWLPQPSLEYAKGYANFLKQPVMPASLAISLLVCNTHISAVENAPPLGPPESRFPVMIFSHGLGGSRNAYSQWCGSVASYGVFVAAIEHRDGSAPTTVVRAGTEKQSSVPYRRMTEFNDETKPLRTSQLAQRTYEVAQLVSVLRDVNHGKEVGLDGKKASILDQFKGLLNTKKGQMIMAGHSFGAATTVAACKDKENVESDYPLKDEFKAALCLDIWMMPLTAIPTAEMAIPSLHVISDQFLKWKENYSYIPALLNESRQTSAFGKAFCLKGSAHLSQSDFQLLFPNLCRRYFHANRDAREVMDINIRAGVEFLREVGVEGIQGKKDVIFEERDIEAWEELEKDI